MHTRIIILLPQFTKYFSAQKNLFSPKLSNEADVVKLLKTGLWGKNKKTSELDQFGVVRRTEFTNATI